MANNTYIFGANTDIKWMTHITIADEVSREKRDCYMFFKTRADADTYVAGLANNILDRNIVIRVIKVKCIEGDDILGI